jgi:hypothetical protein
MPPSLHPLTPAHHDAAADVIADAFLDDPGWVAVGPRNPAARRRYIRRVVHGALRAGERWCGPSWYAGEGDDVHAVLTGCAPGLWPPPRVRMLRYLATGPLLAGPAPLVRSLATERVVEKAHPAYDHFLAGPATRPPFAADPPISRGAPRATPGAKRLLGRAATRPRRRASARARRRPPSPPARDRRARGVGRPRPCDREVPSAERGDLRQVRDADDLAPVASARSCSPTARAVWPPMPASISSKTSVVVLAPATPCSASITRDSSPPEAISRTGPRARRGSVAMRNSTASAPPGPGSRADSSTSNSRLHRQLRRAAHDRGRERGGGRGPRRAQRLGPRAPPSRQRLVEGALRSSAPPRRRQLVAARAARLGVREHRGDRCRRACASGGRAREALLDDVQPPGLGLEPLAVAAQLAARSSASIASARKRSPARRARHRRRHAVQPAARRRPARPRAAVPVLGRERLAPPSRRRAQRLDVAQPLALGEQSSAPRPRRRDVLDLGELELEQVELALARAGALAQLGQRVSSERTARVRGRARRAALRLLRAAEAASRISSCAEASVSLRCSCWP